MGSAVGVCESDASGDGVTVGDNDGGLPGVAVDDDGLCPGNGVGVMIMVVGSPKWVAQVIKPTPTKTKTLAKTNHKSIRIQRFISIRTLLTLSMNRIIPRCD